MKRRILLTALGALAMAGTAMVVAAQGRGFGFGYGPQVDEASLIHNVPYDGRYTFARVRYATGPGGYYYGGLPAWAHGYPRAEEHLLQILGEVSDFSLRSDASNVIALDDPELMKYPIAYMTEAGFWTMTDKEAAGLRAYLQKGGFLVFDDFRGGDGSFGRGAARGGGGWANFEANMKRVIPDGRFVDMDIASPVFHSFFEIPTFDIVKQDYDEGRPAFRGLFEDNDPTKRLMVMVNFNTDVANFWEFSATSRMPVSASNEAYKLGVDYIIYGMTH
jgi:hypothetical protein